MTRPAASVLPLALLATLVTACSGEIYLRDGVTDGDTFYLADRALADPDPVLQSWVAYSLAISACQLQIGGDNPARSTSFECEATARRLLVDTWLDKKALDPALRDSYLDDLAAVDEAGLLPEYVARHFRRQHWEMPADLDVDAYRHWARRDIPGHRPETRIVGSWNYAHNVSSF